MIFFGLMVCFDTFRIYSKHSAKRHCYRAIPSDHDFSELYRKVAGKENERKRNQQQ